VDCVGEGRPHERPIEGEPPGTLKAWVDDLDRQGFRRGKSNGKWYVEGLMIRVTQDEQERDYWNGND
jgi:putative NADPH-quinone reductase